MQMELEALSAVVPIIATSGPSSVWPKKAYRNPTDQLVKFLDYKHQSDWSIFEFRAEGTGYPDSEVYNRIHHFPWPDHHPPPFAIIPALMASMRNWIQGEGQDGTAGEKPASERKRRVAVVHCKAGKGRSGTAACTYLISEEGWKKVDALQRFTDRRMRVGFGSGVSIPSQLRWVGYVDRWTNSMKKQYVERPVQILELHVWGIRNGVKVAVEGYVENGRRIQGFHTFQKDEKIVVDKDESHDDESKSSEITSSASSLPKNGQLHVPGPPSPSPSRSVYDLPNGQTSTSPSGVTILLKPSNLIVLPTSDVKIDFEQRNKASYTGWNMVTSVAHVWFNAYFEGGHEGNDSGVFEIDWEAMDGIKGSSRKGTRALDRLKVVWRYASQNKASVPPLDKVVVEPAEGEPVPEPGPADWKGDKDKEAAADANHSGEVISGRSEGAILTKGATIVAGPESLGEAFGVQKQDPTSAENSRASGVRSISQLLPPPPPPPPIDATNDLAKGETQTEEPGSEGVRSHGPNGQETILTYKDQDGKDLLVEETEGKADPWTGRPVETGVSGEIWQDDSEQDKIRSLHRMSTEREPQ